MHWKHGLFRPLLPVIGECGKSLDLPSIPPAYRRGRYTRRYIIFFSLIKTFFLLYETVLQTVTIYIYIYSRRLLMFFLFSYIFSTFRPARRHWLSPLITIITISRTTTTSHYAAPHRPPPSRSSRYIQTHPRQPLLKIIDTPHAARQGAYNSLALFTLLILLSSAYIENCVVTSPEQKTDYLVLSYFEVCMKSAVSLAPSKCNCQICWPVRASPDTRHRK